MPAEACYARLDCTLQNANKGITLRYIRLTAFLLTGSNLASTAQGIRIARRRQDDRLIVVSLDLRHTHRSAETAMPKILVVEDEKTIALAVQHNLRREGYEAEIAGDGEEALGAFDEQVPDLIILDLMLPKIDGLTVCRRLRQKSSVPILMLTARTEEMDRVVGLEIGADDYMTKPFSMRELISRVGAILRRVEMDRSALAKAASAPPMVSAGDVTIDVPRHEVRQSGRPVELTPREFDLLLYLVSHRGEVVSRDVLLEQVWGFSFAGDTRTVDVHIRGLRAKLGDEGPIPRYIETVRRVGYRFR